jgi:hypothetical protein
VGSSSLADSSPRERSSSKALRSICDGRWLARAGIFYFKASPSARQHNGNVQRCQNSLGTEKTDADTQKQAAVSHHGGPSSGFQDLARCVAIGKRPYCRGGSGLRGGSGWRDGGDEGGLGDAGCRDGSGSRAGMKLPPKKKGTPSSDHSFPFALRTFSRVVMAIMVRFSFRAIEGLSIFEFSSAKSCASSAGVHGRPLGAGPASFRPHIALGQRVDGLDRFL